MTSIYSLKFLNLSQQLHTAPTTMEPRTNLKLLFLSLCLVVSLNCATSGRLAPSLAPVPQPASSPSTSPSPSPSPSQAQAPDYSREEITLSTLSPSESEAVDSGSDASSESKKDDSNSNSKTTLDVKKEDSDNSSEDKKEDSDDSSDDKKDSDDSSEDKKEDSDDSSDDKKEDSDSSSEDKKDESSSDDKKDDSSSDDKKDDSSSDDKKDDSSSDGKKDESNPDVKKDAPAINFGADLHAVAVNPELKKICDQTDHSALCVATVLPLIKDSAKANVNSVLQVAVEATSTYAKEALSEAKNLATKPGTPEDVKATLKDCEDGYGSAVENFQKTIDAFATNDLGTMRAMLSAVITFVGDCQDQFTEMQVQSPLTGYSEKLTEMTSNCLAISSLETPN